MIQSNKQNVLTAVLAALVAVLILSIIILASVPPISRDALVHHLAVPKLWIKHGGMYEIPDLVFSYYPMTLDILYLIPLYFGNDIIPKYFHFAFALATSWLIFSYLRNRLDMFFAIMGVLFFLSTPVIVKLSITAYVDLGLVFFSTAGLIYALKWHEDFPQIKYLFMSAIFCGLALGTKYNGLIVFLLLTLLIVFIVSLSVSNRKHIKFKPVFYIILFVVTVGFLYSPWGIRNYIWTGNPVYPLFDSLFNSTTPREMQSLPPFVLRKILYHETLWEIALIPFRIFFEGMDDSPRYFDGKLNPALLVLPFFAFVASTKDNKDTVKKIFEKGMIAAFSILFILLVFLKTSMRIRYVAPAIPCLAILSMFGVKNIFLIISERFAGNTRRVIMGLSLIAVLLPFSFNAVYIIEQFRVVAPFEYLSGNVSRNQYIERFRPEYAAIQHANNFLPSDAKILSLFIGGRGYYSEREMIFDFDLGLFQTLIHTSDVPEKMRATLTDRGFTHLLIRFDMFENWCHNNLNQKEKQMVIDFLSIGESLLFAKNGHGIYKL